MRLVHISLLALATVLVSACATDPDPVPEVETEVPAAAAPDDSIVGIVDTSPQLSTFASALASTELAEALRDPDGAYTLFAPSDAAFLAIPDAERSALIADEAQLTALLRSHALPTRMLSPDIFDGLAIETLAGTELALSSDGTTVQISDASGTQATVVTADLDTSNGVVHIIDTVLFR